MIDWLKLRLEVPATGRVPGDRVMILSPEGDLKWERVKALPVTGSYESDIQVSACPVTGKLVIDGNPVKFFQGHNCFGTDDIHGLARATSLHVLDRLPGLEITASDRETVDLGCYELARVDLTGMYALGTMAHATSAVRSIGERATMRHRGRGTLSRDGTAYFGKHSRRWALKLYAKGCELKDHRLHKDLPHRAEITLWAADKLRVEIVLRGMELKARGLERLRRWEQNTAATLYSEFLGRLQVPDNIELDPPALAGLKPRLRLAYDSWMRGTDLRTALPRKTFYRYRRELLAHGIDILTVRPAEPKSNVLPLIRILEARPVGVPEWAIGTPIYFDPSRAA